MMSPTTAVEIKINYSGSHSYDGLPEHTFTMLMEDATELSSGSWFLLFERVLGALGYCETAIMSGACSLAFNELRDPAEMKKVAIQHDLRLVEDPDPTPNVRLAPTKNPENKALYELVRNSIDLYLWPQTLAIMFRIIADQVQVSGEDQYGVYQTTGEDVREWLYKEAQKADDACIPENESEHQP